MASVDTESPVPRIKAVLGTMTFGGQVDAAGARAMLDLFSDAGCHELDTAYIYCDGRTEELLGTLLRHSAPAAWYIATKAHPSADGSLQPASVRRQLLTSLGRMETDRVDLFYLHSPDLGTPIRETLEACWELYQAGHFGEFGLSNYAAWQVAEIAQICESKGWMKPTVYQGMYNPLTRDVERELFPCLRNYGIRFYAYNPLAGGMLSAKHTQFNGEFGGGRFDLNSSYRERYWNRKYFEAVTLISNACGKSNVLPAAAALRWMAHHSMLCAGSGDAVILGASTIAHFEDNLSAIDAAPLPAEVVAAFDQGWEITRPACMKYFRP